MDYFYQLSSAACGLTNQLPLLQRELTVTNIGYCHVIILHTNTSVKEIICNLKGSSSYEYLLGTTPLALNILSLLEKLIASS